MSLEKVYYTVNKLFESYLNEGVKADHLVNYLNVNEENFKYIYNRVYKLLTIENIQFTSEQLKECLIDIIEDKINLINDLKNIKES